MGTTSQARTAGDRPRLTRTLTVLLACGIVSSALYVLTDIVLSASWGAYSYTSQMISELGAIGAPTRGAWIAMSMFYNPLVLAFGLGVWRAAHKRSLKVAGALLMFYGVVSFMGPFVPMHQRGAAGSLTDLLHITNTALTVLATVLFIAFGSGASGKGFRLFSLASLAAIVLGGAAAGYAGAQMASGGATPWFGVLERVNIYTMMLWIAALGAVLIRDGRQSAEVARAVTSPRPGALVGR